MKWRGRNRPSVALENPYWARPERSLRFLAGARSVEMTAREGVRFMESGVTVLTPTRIGLA